MAIRPTQTFPGLLGTFTWLFRANSQPSISKTAWLAAAPGLHPTSVLSDCCPACGRACVPAQAADRIGCTNALQAAVWSVGIFGARAKSLALWSGEETRHVGTFVCEIRNTETQEASQIPQPSASGVLITHIHTLIHLLIDNNHKWSVYSGSR